MGFGCIWSGYERSNDDGTMMSVVFSYMCFLVECCKEVCSRRSVISSSVLDGVLISLERCVGL